WMGSARYEHAHEWMARRLDGLMPDRAIAAFARGARPYLRSRWLHTAVSWLILGAWLTPTVHEQWLVLATIALVAALRHVVPRTRGLSRWSHLRTLLDPLCVVWFPLRGNLTYVAVVVGICDAAVSPLVLWLRQLTSDSATRRGIENFLNRI